ncbi:hypothetical protein V8F20_006125 [Naviculisporaceae sp. PSN 640]
MQGPPLSDHHDAALLSNAHSSSTSGFNVQQPRRTSEPFRDMFVKCPSITFYTGLSRNACAGWSSTLQMEKREKPQVLTVPSVSDRYRWRTVDTASRNSLSPLTSKIRRTSKSGVYTRQPDPISVYIPECLGRHPSRWPRPEAIPSPGTWRRWVILHPLMIEAGKISLSSSDEPPPFPHKRCCILLSNLRSSRGQNIAYHSVS